MQKCHIPIEMIRCKLFYLKIPFCNFEVLELRREWMFDCACERCAGWTLSVAILTNKKNYLLVVYIRGQLTAFCADGLLCADGL